MKHSSDIRAISTGEEGEEEVHPLGGLGMAPADINFIKVAQVDIIAIKALDKPLGTTN